MNKKVIILALAAIFVLVIVGIILVFSFTFNPKNAGKPSEKLMEERTIPAPGKVLEIVFHYDKGAKPQLAINNLSIKNGYAPTLNNDNQDHTIEIIDNKGTVLARVPFSITNKLKNAFHSFNNDGEAEKVDFIVTIDWIQSAHVLKVTNKNGVVIISKSLDNVPILDNKPNFGTFSYDTNSKKVLPTWQPLPLLGSVALAAGPDGYLDMVFVGDRYDDFASFQNDVLGGYRAQLESIQPFKSRKDQLSYNHINIFNGSYCTIEPGMIFPSCDFVKVMQDVNSASVPYDNVIILLNNGSGAFSASQATGYSRPLQECCLAVINTLPFHESPEVSRVVFVHELGHLLSGLNDEYEAPPISSGRNCSDVKPNPAWSDLVALGDYRQRCSDPNWWRPFEISIMDNTSTVKYFNAPSQKILNENLDSLAGPFSNSSNPNASINSPSNGATVSGTVQVTTSLSDDLGVARANLYVKGPLDSTGVLYQTAYETPFTFNWDTAGYPNGSYELEVRAYDVPGNFGFTKITVNTGNATTNSCTSNVVYFTVLDSQNPNTTTDTVSNIGTPGTTK